MEQEVIIMDNGKPFVPKAELRTFAPTPTLLLANPCQATDSYTTEYNANNSQDGIMFDVIAKTNISITCFEGNLGNVLGDEMIISIYAKYGSCIGSENNPSDWNLLGTSDVIIVNGLDVPTYIPININFVILAGQKASFYITSTLTGNYPTNYTNGTNGLGSVFSSNNDLSVCEGFGKEYPFSTSYEPRQFNGTIYYNQVKQLTLQGVVRITESGNYNLVLPSNGIPTQIGLPLQNADVFIVIETILTPDYIINLFLPKISDFNGGWNPKIYILNKNPIGDIGSSGVFLNSYVSETYTDYLTTELRTVFQIFGNPTVNIFDNNFWGISGSR